MKSINFNTGIKEYAVNGDENNVISINVSDINMLKRIRDAESLFDPIISKLDKEEVVTPEMMVEIDKEIKEKLDCIFGTDISAHVFGNMNCLSPLEDGRLLFMSFFEAFSPMVIEDINRSRENFADNKAKNLKKYLPPDQKDESVPQGKKSKEKLDLSSLSEEQIAFLKQIVDQA